MIEWLADQLIKGTEDINGDSITYTDAINIIKKRVSEDLLDKKIEEFNNILIFKGYSKLIKK